MQHLVLLTFVLLVAGLTTTYYKLPGGLSKTFSQRVAGNKTAEILYSLLFITTLPLLFLFFVAWFVPEKQVYQIFLVFAMIAIIFQILCTLVPERAGIMTTIHRVLTGISGIALLPMVFLIAMASSISAAVRAIAWFALCFMITLLIVALLNQKGFKYALLLQVGYYTSFFTIVLAVTYTH